VVIVCFSEVIEIELRAIDVNIDRNRRAKLLFLGRLALAARNPAARASSEIGSKVPVLL
jgi:hypothetical protein